MSTENPIELTPEQLIEDFKIKQKILCDEYLKECEKNSKLSKTHLIVYFHGLDDSVNKYLKAFSIVTNKLPPYLQCLKDYKKMELDIENDHMAEIMRMYLDGCIGDETEIEKIEMYEEGQEEIIKQNLDKIRFAPNLSFT